MSFTVTDAFVQQFNGTVGMLAQQSNARMRGRVLEDQITGDSGYFEQLAPTTARKRTTRHGDSPVANMQHLRRRIAIYDYEQGELIDELDKVALLIDPASDYTKNISYAMRRAQDDEIFNAVYATAYTGHSGATAVSWPNGNNESSPTAPGGTVVAVNSWTYGNGSGNAGLTVSKVTEAKVALDAIEGDEEEERFIVVDSKGVGEMLATTEATSADYNSVRSLVDGKIDTFLGFTWIRTERLPKDGSGYRRLFAYRKSALGLGIGKDITSTINQRWDKSGAWYPYANEKIGAARLEEGKIAEIKCA